MAARFLNALLLTCLCIGFAMAGDTTHFRYDGNGNRTDKRLIVMEDLNTFMSQPTRNRDTHYEQMGNIKMTLYPNPTTGEVHIRFSGIVWNNPMDQGWQIHVYSTSGALLLTQNVYGPLGKINLQTLPSGLYYLQIVREETTSSWPLLKK